MMKTKINTEESGQALLEFAFVLVLLCVFVYGVIDCSRAIYYVEVMKNLVGEGSSMASRGTSPAKTAQIVATYAGADINLDTLGCVIVTTVTNNAGTLAVTAQAAQGGITCTSKVGCLQGQGGCASSGAVLPQAARDALLSEVSGSSLYVTEIYYTYNTVTPIPAFLGNNILPSQLYSAAYF